MKVARAWDHPKPFVIELTVESQHIDELGHTNNVHYLAWLQECTWQHSIHVGLSPENMLATGCAMAVRNVHMQYLGATFVGDRLHVGDWISATDARLRATRTFQIVRQEDARTVLRAEIEFICINVESGRPKRMPPVFAERYTLS